MATNTPINPNPKTINPGGTAAALTVASEKDGSSNSGAGVNVASPFAETAGTKAACSVGSMVGVAMNVGVGGAAMIGSACEESVTFAANTHPTPFRAPGYRT